jgi:hypothetical protein
MPIATKTNQVIVKSGGVAANCECCEEILPCCSNGLGLPSTPVSVTLYRKLELFLTPTGRMPYCSCVPFGPAGPLGVCTEDTTVFSQIGLQTACERDVFGYPPEYAQSGRLGYVALGSSLRPCGLVAYIDWPFVCARNFRDNVRPFAVWDFLANQSTYQQTYYLFQFVNSNETVFQVVRSNLPDVPSPPPNTATAFGFVYAGVRWQVSIEVTFG